MGLIVVATDGSPAAAAALDAALDLAEATGHTIALVTVWQALQGDFGLVHPAVAVLPDLLDAERRHAEETLREGKRHAEQRGIPIETQLLTGSPAETIVRFADEHAASLLACGTRGHGTVAELVLGSVSRELIRRASCPVVVTRSGRTPDVAGAQLGSGSSSMPLTSA
jgi:nucleotide-binding universal stress UspA family protein